MRASFYEGGRRFRVGLAAMPSAGPDEALLRVRRVGICGTDLHIFQGHLDHRIPRGGVIGHETLAEVAEAPAASGFRAGERVVVEPLRTCGTCRACRMGATYLCYRLRVLGVEDPGGMQDYWVVPTDRLLRVPATLGDDEAAVIEPLAVATHDVRRAEVRPDDAVLVFGGGPIGALIAMVARQRGARVVVTEVNPFRVDMLRKLGLEVIGPGRDLPAFVDEWTGGDGADVVFEVTGNPAAVKAMTGLVRVWGTISMVAIHGEPLPVDLYRFFARELTMHGSRLYSRDDWEEAIRLAAAGAVTLAPLVTRKVPLESLQQAMEDTLNGAPVMKVLIDMTAV
jgi:(R,R)-butanediol dehydrogenase / meso-butanediol dehydrogenase / diacetyl reductase